MKLRFELRREERPSPAVPVPPNTFMVRIIGPTRGHSRKCFSIAASDLQMVQCDSRYQKPARVEVLWSRKLRAKEIRIRGLGLTETE